MQLAVCPSCVCCSCPHRCAKSGRYLPRNQCGAFVITSPAGLAVGILLKFVGCVAFFETLSRVVPSIAMRTRPETTDNDNEVNDTVETGKASKVASIVHGKTVDSFIKS